MPNLPGSRLLSVPGAATQIGTEAVFRAAADGYTLLLLSTPFSTNHALFGKLPEVVVACVGGGSNAAGMFYPFVDDTGVQLVGVEAGGRGRGRPPR